MDGFKFSKLHCPIHRVQVKKRHYKFVLFVASVSILAAHHYTPDYESHVAVLVNILFVIDPTV